MSTDEEAIRRLVATWHKATADGDVDTVLALMAEDVVFLVAGHPPMRGRNAFEQGLRGLLRQHRVESTGISERLRCEPVGCGIVTVNEDLQDTPAAGATVCGSGCAF